MRASTTNPQTAQPPSTLKPWRAHSKQQAMDGYKGMMWKQFLIVGNIKLGSIRLCLIDDSRTRTSYAVLGCCPPFRLGRNWCRCRSSACEISNREATTGTPSNLYQPNHETAKAKFTSMLSTLKSWSLHSTKRQSMSMHGCKDVMWEQFSIVWIKYKIGIHPTLLDSRLNHTHNFSSKGMPTTIPAGTEVISLLNKYLWNEQSGSNNMHQRISISQTTYCDTTPLPSTLKAWSVHLKHQSMDGC
jgi:hypothetical protein